MDVNSANFDNEVLKATGKVLVDFWAPWCGPCRMQGPILDKMASSGNVRAKIVKVNIDENQGIASNYSIQSIPTMILFENGKEVKRFVGVQPEEILKNYLS